MVLGKRVKKNTQSLIYANMSEGSWVWSNTFLVYYLDEIILFSFTKM